MKKVILVLSILLLIACKAKKPAVHSVVADQLATILDKNISYNDSIANRKNLEPYNSYWVVFSERKPWSMTIEPYYDYYDLNKMDGYFYHKNKIISVYNYNKAFAYKFVNIALLQKNGIKKLQQKSSEETANDFWRLYAIEGDTLRFLPKS